MSGMESWCVDVVVERLNDDWSGLHPFRTGKTFFLVYNFDLFFVVSLPS